MSWRSNVLLPRRYVIGWAVLMQACRLPMVLPIVLSENWTLLIQGAFVAAGVALLVATLRREQGVKRPRFRIRSRDTWVLTVVVVLALSAGFAVAIYARAEDDPWLGAAALLINFAAYLAVYGGLGFLLRRQLTNLT